MVENENGRILIGDTVQFNDNRALLTLDHEQDLPKSLVIYTHDSKFYCMASTCLHSAGPLHLGKIEEDIEDITLVCPWHAYKFSIVDGKCLNDETFNTNVYPVVIEGDSVYVLFPTSTKVVSITFFQGQRSGCDTETLEQLRTISIEEKEVDTTNFTLVDWAVFILNTADPTKKVQLTFKVAEDWSNGKIDQIGISDKVPDRPARHKQLEIVNFKHTKKMGKAGTVKSRISILHALANVEQWAIDLAWDIIARYSGSEFQGKDGPVSIQTQKEFFSDFVRVAKEEAKHYSFLVSRLESLGSYFGALPVHDGLWDSAVVSFDSLLSRLCIVHMVHEARGLDVNPNTISKFEKSGDWESVEKLKIIHRDEIGHVAAGQRWFSWICSVTGQDRYETFHEIVKKLFYGPLRPPFNDEDRLLAGLDPQYYLPLSNLNK